MTTATLPLPVKDELPAELVKPGVKRWIIWRYENDRKIPYQANAPYAKASTTTPANWTHFDVALAAARRYGAGVGYVFTADDGYVGIDLDDCLDERGALTPWAVHILRLAGETYAEISPSGRGIKVWVRGSLPEGKGVKMQIASGGGVEAYDRARYFTVTGQRWNNAPLTIGDGVQAIEYILSLARSAAQVKHTNGHMNGHTNGVHLPPVAKIPNGKGVNVILSLIDQVRSAPEGNRNNTLNKAGYTLGGLLASGTLRGDEADAYAALMLNAAIKAGLPEDEARTTLVHSIERGKKAPFDPDAWEAPLPLPDEDALTPPDFPMHVLPDTYRRYVEEIATETQVDPAMAAMAGLAVASGALCGTTRIAARKGAHIEQPGLYVAIVAPTGERKSAVLKHILEPVVAHERSERQRVRERDQRLKAARAELAEAKRAKDDARVAELQNRVRDLEYESEHALSRELLVTDATSQALSAMLNKTGGRALVASAEGDIVEHVGGRYNDGNPDLNIYLSGYSADPLRILRKERNEFVEAPSLAVLQMMQPARLREFLRIPTVIQRGLAARMLFIIPQSRLGERTYYPPNIARQAKARVEEAIMRLLEYEVRAYDNERSIVGCSQAAEDVFEAWHYEIEAQLARDDVDETLKNWLARGVGHAMRLAHVICRLRVELDGKTAGGGVLVEIGEEDARAGVILAKYCLEHLKVALSVKNANDEIELARAVVSWIIRDEATEITTRDVYRKLNGRAAVRSAQDVARVLETLEAFRYIRRCERERRGGRPSERWRVNPLVFAEPEV